MWGRRNEECNDMGVGVLVGVLFLFPKSFHAREGVIRNMLLLSNAWIESVLVTPILMLQIRLI